MLSFLLVVAFTLPSWLDAVVPQVCKEGVVVVSLVNVNNCELCVLPTSELLQQLRHRTKLIGIQTVSVVCVQAKRRRDAATYMHRKGNGHAWVHDPEGSLYREISGPRPTAIAVVFVAGDRYVITSKEDMERVYKRIARRG